ncbi:MAG: DUF488 domain-containing protein, partial [Myxococcota bacterium]|nr:DUF488 domain-containing protein [Myxococcota bacterium]
ALLTVGHSNHALEHLIRLLRGQEVTTVADVRSVPWSRRHPWFQRAPLARALEEAGIAYLFLGEALGARPREPALRDASGRADFARIAATGRFRAGLARVRELAARERPALLCAERDPADCHRTLLVCRHLRRDPALRILHLLADGRLEPHADTERRLLRRAGLAQAELFADDDPVERAYDRLGRRIAHVRPPDARGA